jgi:hypothetical protein
MTTCTRPPGEVLDDRWSPALVMQDELGVFVSSGRFRHYCATLADARKVAAALQDVDGETEVKS